MLRPGPPARWRPTLAQGFATTFLALAVVLAGLLWLFYSGSKATLLSAAQQLMAQTSSRAAGAVEANLEEAEQVVADFEAERSAGTLRIDDPEGARTALLAALVRRKSVSAVSLTHGEVEGFYSHDADGHEAGDVRLRAGGRWQVSAARVEGGLELTTLASAGGRWEVSAARVQSELDATVASDPDRRAGAALQQRLDHRGQVEAATDPTEHPTFTTPARADQRGRTLWSDLSFAEGPGQRRVVTVQKALWADSKAVGVLRVSLLAERIDELTHVRFEERAGRRPLVFLADERGRLVARTAPEDRVVEMEDEVRVVPAVLSPALGAALAAPLLGALAPGQEGITRLHVASTTFLLHVRALPEGRTQGWRVGVLAPEDWFLEDLQSSLRRVLLAAALLALACLGGGALLLRASRRDLGGLIDEATRLRSFDFSSAPARDPVFHDVLLASDSLDQARTALRALGKYVPLDLVRQLYEARDEPVLGGRVQDMSMLFTDVEGFTSISERLPLDVLAGALGRYLEAMTRAIHRAGGIIDKYAGDGVMALWNAPSPCAHHPRRGCEAVLACQEETERLFSSPEWAGLPRWRTRFGLHCAEVSVGHFGSPDRMSFTVMGDGVNLAARLESLNKQYGTSALVSADVEQVAREHFAFRRLDRVAVKGKQRGVEVFELLGPRSADGSRPPEVVRYEAALTAYFERRFGEALELLRASPSDRPSAVLAARCLELQAAPPPQDWDGVFHPSQK